MKPAAMRVLLTGATGGIGGAIAAELRRRGASVLLVGRAESVLRPLVETLGAPADHVAMHVADLATESGRIDVVRHASNWRCNVLVNSAGVGEFALVDQQTDAGLERLFAVNVLAPMQLTRALLPHLRDLPEAAVLNVGSVFGSLAYPGFAAYSATKFALRGYTEALRRELADTGVRVHYLAPRATRTGMNAAAVERMNAELGVAMDPPGLVARAAGDMLEQGRCEAVLGWPEKAFVRINALLPRVVDGSLRKQLAIIRHHARSAEATQPHRNTGGDR
jgi:short-subunit dehydrogenase